MRDCRIVAIFSICYLPAFYMYMRGFCSGCLELLSVALQSGAAHELGSARVLLHRLRERGGSSHIQAPVTLPKSTKQKGYVSLVLEFIPSRAAPANQLDAYPQHAPQPQAQPQEQVAMGYPAGSTYPDMYAQYPPIGTFGGASGHSAPQIATASGALPYPGMHGGHPAQPHAMHGPASAAGAPSAHHVHSYSGPSTSSGTTHIGPPPSGYPGGGAAAGAPAMHGYGGKCQAISERGGAQHARVVAGLAAAVTLMTSASPGHSLRPSTSPGCSYLVIGCA
eukprot:365253-Chlamydomonas_euryale.AAC.34